MVQPVPAADPVPGNQRPTVKERARTIQVVQSAHVMAGRIGGPADMATFCSCGHAFYGVSQAQADNGWQVHVQGDDATALVDED